MVSELPQFRRRLALASTGSDPKEFLADLNHRTVTRLGPLVREILSTDDADWRHDFRLMVAPAGFIGLSIRPLDGAIPTPIVGIHLWDEEGVLTPGDPHDHMMHAHSTTVSGGIRHTFFETAPGDSMHHFYFQRRGGLGYQEHSRGPIDLRVLESPFVGSAGKIFFPKDLIHTASTTAGTVTVVAETPWLTDGFNAFRRGPETGLDQLDGFAERVRQLRSAIPSVRRRLAQFL